MSPAVPDKHRFTIHFDVSHDVFSILNALGRQYGRSPNDAARDILLAWMEDVAKTTKPSEMTKPSEND